MTMGREEETKLPREEETGETHPRGEETVVTQGFAIIATKSATILLIIVQSPKERMG